MITVKRVRLKEEKRRCPIRTWRRSCFLSHLAPNDHIGMHQMLQTLSSFKTELFSILRVEIQLAGWQNVLSVVRLVGKWEEITVLITSGAFCILYFHDDSVVGIWILYHKVVLFFSVVVYYPKEKPTTDMSYPTRICNEIFCFHAATKTFCV